MVDAGLAVCNGTIVATGSIKELVATYGKPTVEFPGCVLLPGFVNAHTHLELTDFLIWQKRLGPPPSQPATFTDWIIELIRVKRTVSPQELFTSVQSGLTMSIQSGTTTVGDNITLPELLAAYQDSPINARLFLELIGQDPLAFAARLQDAITATSQLSSGHLPGLAPHAPYTLNRRLLPDIAQAAAEHCLPLSLHLAESPDESELLASATGPLADKLYPLVGWQQYLPQPTGVSPTESVFPLLGPNTLAVHGVQLSQQDIIRLRDSGTSLCLCPRSNTRLGVGTAPVKLFKQLGLKLCLGTDSLASNDSLSLWDEIRFALDCYQGVLKPEELLLMATVGGATALGIAGQTGSLLPGKRADLQVVKLSGPLCIETLLDRSRPDYTTVGGRLANAT